MEMMRGASGIKDRVLDSAVEFNDILFFNAERFLSKLIESFLICSFTVELLPAASEHNLRALRKTKGQASFLQDLKQEEGV